MPVVVPLVVVPEVVPVVVPLVVPVVVPEVVPMVVPEVVPLVVLYVVEPVVVPEVVEPAVVPYVVEPEVLPEVLMPSVVEEGVVLVLEQDERARPAPHNTVRRRADQRAFCVLFIDGWLREWMKIGRCPVAQHLPLKPLQPGRCQAAAGVHGKRMRFRKNTLPTEPNGSAQLYILASFYTFPAAF